MEPRRIWSWALAACVVLIVGTTCYYVDCVIKYSAASGKVPSDVDMPSASAVCEKYKR
jgi:hypothetical protein